MEGRNAYRSMREVAADDRPRERLLRHGPEVLSDTELVAILLGSGMPGENVLDLARNLLDSHAGLPGLMRTDAKAMQRTRGLGPAKAALLAAALELGRRIQAVDPESRPHLRTPEAVYAYLGPRLAGKTREELYVLPLDMKTRLLGAPVPLRGTVNSVPVRPSEAFREPIIADAVSVIFVHNHPSGDPQPSPQDVEVTRGLAAAGELLGIEVLDHVVIGQGRFASMAREGYLDTPGRPRPRR